MEEIDIVEKIFMRENLNCYIRKYDRRYEMVHGEHDYGEKDESNDKN